MAACWAISVTSRRLNGSARSARPATSFSNGVERRTSFELTLGSRIDNPKFTPAKWFQRGAIGRRYPCRLVNPNRNRTFCQGQIA